jgi:2-dehydro-3-deoxygalactonokinase
LDQSPKPSSAGALIAVDWGTTRLRAMLLDRDGGLVAEVESGDGIGTLTGHHEEVLDRLIGDWPKVPAILAGMIGSRQGWREAPYVECPADIARLATKAIRFMSEHGRDVAIVPGLMLRDRRRDGDVIRGEETQAVGLVDREPAFRGVSIHPGTHSKWAAISDGTITGFQTFLTGEIFDLLSRVSFLRHSVASDGRDLAAVPDFALAVRRTAAEGLPFLAAIFSVRVRQLLDGVAREDNLAYLSGLVIGGEIAAARSAGWLTGGEAVRIVGSRSLAHAYARAFAIIGQPAEAVDGGGMARFGLVRLARTIGFLEGTAPL